MSLDRWAGTTVLITGASRGIGEAVARAAHDRGAKVGLLARSADDLERLAAELGPRTAFATADVSERASVDDAITALTEALGLPGILVNNAGIGSYASFLEEDVDAFERLMAVNYLGTVHATRAALPWMIDRGSGHIVNVGSIAGRLGAPFETAYSASKFAVVGFTEALAAEVHGLGIHVSLVQPGPVRTHFTEARGVPFQQRVPHPVTPERVAEAVLHSVDAHRFEQIVPRWLKGPTVVRALAPRAYRAGLGRSFAKQSRALSRRLRGR
jgi:3-oxoacyl-[acyl-carrier protein] reductase